LFREVFAGVRGVRPAGRVQAGLTLVPARPARTRFKRRKPQNVAFVQIVPAADFERGT
jgi:hypothetical protein